MIVGIYINFKKDCNAVISNRIIFFLEQERIKYFVLDSENIDDIRYDIIITVGGDGTLLNVVEKAVSNNIPILGINKGRLGYLTEDVIEKVEDTISKIITKDYLIEERHLIETSFFGKTMYALNDFCIVRNTLNIIDLKMYIDGVFAQEYRSDGIIIATATGSTAYSLSAGGPIIEPEVGVMVVTPICPHSLSSRSLVLGLNRTVRILSDSDNVSFVFDGKTIGNLSKGDFIECRISERKLKLVRLKRRNFYEVLREKIKE